MTVDTMIGLYTRLRAAVTPRTFRLPLVLLPPGSMLISSVRLMVEQMVQLRFVTLVNRHTFTADPKTYGTVTLMVNSMEVMMIGIPWWLTRLEIGLETKELIRDTITTTTDMMDMAMVDLPMDRLTQPRTTHSRQMPTTRQVTST